MRCMCDQSESEHFCFAFGQRPSLLPGWENAQKNGGIDIMIMINDSMGKNEDEMEDKDLWVQS